MKLEEAKDTLKNKIGDYVIAEYCSDCMKKRDCVDDCEFHFAIDTVLQELERLQKENEKYISGELITRNQAKHFEEINKKYYIHKDKIREKIAYIKKTPNSPHHKVIATQIDASLIACLQDLLKEE